jgi:hypothetical protein
LYFVCKWSLYLNRHDITEILLKVYLALNLNNSTEYFPVALFTKIRNYSPNFSLKIILRQFLSPFHKDYLTTDFNLTTKITLTIKNSSLGVLDKYYVIKFVSDLRQVNGFLRVLQFSPPIKLTDILLKGALNTIYINHLP